MKIEKTIDLFAEDKNTLYHDTFDEFLISDESMHWNDKVIYFSE